MKTYLVFEGFYESVWSRMIDEEVDGIIKDFEDEFPDVDSVAVAKAVEKFTDYNLIFTKLAQGYVETWNGMVDDDHPILTFQELQSPREYNFVTDRIGCEISYEDAARWLEKVGIEHVARRAADIFTSYEGFISFYDPDPTTWGPLEEWDANQMIPLVMAIEDVSDVGRYSVFEAYEGGIDAVRESVRWKSVSLELEHLVAVAKGEEVGMPGRKFPELGLTPVDYCKSFSEMNHHKP